VTVFEFACVMATVAFVGILIAASRSHGVDQRGVDQPGDSRDQG
jgi:hypothetical protein